MDKSKKNILIIGKGAVASALAKKIAKYDYIDTVFIAPGDGLESDLYKCVDIRETDETQLLKFALEHDIYLTIPTSVEAFKSDIVSFFQDNDQNIFGPTKMAANITISNSACKKFLYKIHAQTSRFGIFDKMNIAQEWLKTANFPVTIRCGENNILGDRLVCPTTSIAEQFLDTLFARNELGVLVEEFTYGHNFTVYFLTDGYSAIPFVTVANYKFLENGDGGFLTNGVGCYTPDYKISNTVLSRVENVARNVLVALDKKGDSYTGIFGVECTLTGDDKFYVNEIKSFLQDFDAAAVLNSVEQDLVQVFIACIQGLFADEYEEIKTNNLSSISVVVHSRFDNKLIEGIDNIEDISNIDFIRGNLLQTQKGECFVLTRCANLLSRAKSYLYEDLEQIKFDGIKYRKDIGLE